jgi:hypothetical protein
LREKRIFPRFGEGDDSRLLPFFGKVVKGKAGVDDLVEGGDAKRG